jgi:hypothetical protein
MKKYKPTQKQRRAELMLAMMKGEEEFYEALKRCTGYFINKDLTMNKHAIPEARQTQARHNNDGKSE